MNKKEFKLIELTLNNFKGVQHFQLKADGRDMKIYGDNATGKTSLFDGFTWLLFGKDSNNRTDFEIKTLDEAGKVKQHGLDHEVEGKFSIDDKIITLKRVYAENWTKKRGSAEKTFSGHSTTYYIDEVPVPKKEYTDKVNEIVSEDVFKLLTNPSHFNQQLSWQERRKILLDIAGDITDEDVAAHSGNKDLQSFIEKLSGRTIEDHKKVINSKKKKVNEELDRIPVRIDEIQRSLPDTSNLNIDNLKAAADQIEGKIDQKQEQINDIKSGGEISNKRKLLSDIELEILELRNNHEYEEKQAVYRTKASIQEMESNIKLLNSKVESYQHTISLNQRRVASLEKDVDQLREQWREQDAKEFHHNEQCECPTCGQSLPEDQLKAARDKALEQFNVAKAEKLESITGRAKSKLAEIEDIQAEMDKDKNKIAALEKDMADKQNKLKKLQEQAEKEQEMVSDITDNPKYIEKLQQKKEIEKEIRTIQDSKDEAIFSVKEEIAALQQERKAIQEDLNKFDMANRSKDRLEELEQQEQELAAEYERLEHELFLTEEFTRKKVDLLEEKINSQFKYARFKLFDQQINGGLKETCETLFEGVPYNSGLNNAARINVGLDIINTLNAHYGVYAPIFIDNSESVTRLIDIEAQTISLVVSENHSKLSIA